VQHFKIDYLSRWSLTYLSIRRRTPTANFFGKSRQKGLNKFAHRASKDILTKAGELLNLPEPHGDVSWDGHTLAAKIRCSPDTVWRIYREKKFILQR